MVDMDLKPTQGSSLIFRMLRWFFGAFAVLVVGLVSCTGAMKRLGKLEREPQLEVQAVDTGSTAYQAACQGAPLLRNTEARNKAMEDGYIINGLYDCIDKASFDAVAKQRAQWAASQTPEALALAEREREVRRNAYAIDQERAQNQSQSESDSKALPAPLALRKVDVNLATEDELASTPGVSTATASQIVTARQNGRFSGWDDLVRRVVGLSAAQPAAMVSISGLTVDGKSLDDGAPDGAMAAMIKSRQPGQKLMWGAR